jgi:hypothetical protein
LLGRKKKVSFIKNRLPELSRFGFGFLQNYDYCILRSIMVSSTSATIMLRPQGIPWNGRRLLTGTMFLVVLCYNSFVVMASKSFSSVPQQELQLEALNDKGDIPVPTFLRRNLQLEQYIAAPAISFSGFVLSLDFTVRDNIRESLVNVKVFQDEDCSKILDFEQNNYLDRNVIPDLTAVGDGSGQRVVCK